MKMTSNSKTNIEKLSTYINQYLDGIYTKEELAAFFYGTILQMSAVGIVELGKRIATDHVYALMQRYEGETCLIRVTSSEVEAQEWENRNDSCVQWSERYEIK